MAALNEAAHRRHLVRVDEDVGALRRAVGALADDLPGVRRGEVDLVTTELATNLVRHTTDGGYVLYRTAGNAVELLSVDRGPGLPAPQRSGSANAAHAVRGREVTSTPTDAPPPPDRCSSGGLHVGLASVERFASQFDCYSTSRGTVLLARLGDVPAPPAHQPWRWGGVNLPLRGTGESGDAWAVTANHRLAALVVDGLGHGPEAATAARAATTVFHERPVEDPLDLLRRVHAAMRTTRGGVVGVCIIDPDREQLTHAGVGNISGRVLHGRTSNRLLGPDGVLGTELRPPRPVVAVSEWKPGATLILTSDGMGTLWSPADYPGLLDHDPAIVAATLHRDHSTDSDDSTVLVVQDIRGRQPVG